MPAVSCRAVRLVRTARRAPWPRIRRFWVSGRPIACSCLNTAIRHRPAGRGADHYGRCSSVQASIAYRITMNLQKRRQRCRRPRHRLSLSHRLHHRGGSDHPAVRRRQQIGVCELKQKCGKSGGFGEFRIPILRTGRVCGWRSRSDGAARVYLRKAFMGVAIGARRGGGRNEVSAGRLMGANRSGQCNSPWHCHGGARDGAAQLLLVIVVGGLRSVRRWTAAPISGRGRFCVCRHCRCSAA